MRNMIKRNSLGGTGVCLSASVFLFRVAYSRAIWRAFRLVTSVSAGLCRSLRLTTYIVRRKLTGVTVLHLLASVPGTLYVVYRTRRTRAARPGSATLFHVFIGCCFVFIGFFGWIVQYHQPPSGGTHAPDLFQLPEPDLT